MFGALRLLLAFMVVFSHLTGSVYIAHFGFYAVRGFFVLSGFLMTAGLNEIYKFDAKRFWANRLLRLLPLYYVVCLLTVLAVNRFPDQAAAYLSYWKPHISEMRAMSNFLVVPLQYPSMHFRLVPPYWSVAVELQMYALLFIAAARSERLALTVLWLGVVYHLACIHDGLGFGARYSAAPSAILAFAAGAVTYFWTKRGELHVNASATTIALIMWIANTFAARSVLPADYAFGPGYYFSTFLFVIVVAGLANVRWSALAMRIDRSLGEIAYPVFLLQWLAGFLTALTLSPGVWRGWSLALASVPVILCMAIALALLNGKLIEPLRDTLRRGIAKRRGIADRMPSRLRQTELSAECQS